ncbi:MAG: 30S ribosomal protein S6 [Candidatus Peregrinibacteria bacterium]
MSTHVQAADEIVANKEVRSYELMLCLNSELIESKQKQKLGEFEEFIKKNGGKIISSDPWGKRPLSYRIGKHRDGVYAVYDFELPTNHVKELSEQARIDVDVLRYILVALPKGYVYTRYVEEAKEPEAEKPRAKKWSEKPMNTRHESVPVERQASVTPPAVPQIKPEPQEVDEAALEKKLGEILGDTDLKI